MELRRHASVEGFAGRKETGFGGLVLRLPHINSMNFMTSSGIGQREKERRRKTEDT